MAYIRSEVMILKEILLFFALKYDGDFQSILKALQRKEKVTNQQREEAVSKVQSKYTTIYVMTTQKH